MPTQKNNDTCFGAQLHSAGTQHGNLHHSILSVTMSTLTCFSLRAHTGTGVSYSQHRENSEAVLETVEIIREEIPGSRRSMHGYHIRTCSRLYEENLWALGSQQMGFYFLRLRWPTAGTFNQDTLECEHSVTCNTIREEGPRLFHNEGMRQIGVTIR